MTGSREGALIDGRLLTLRLSVRIWKFDDLTALRSLYQRDLVGALTVDSSKVCKVLSDLHVRKNSHL